MVASEASSPFLKKRTKKLFLRLSLAFPARSGQPDQQFFASFFEKDGLFFASYVSQYRYSFPAGVARGTLPASRVKEITCPAYAMRGRQVVDMLAGRTAWACENPEKPFG
jgi:hypothetical protein